MRIPSADLPFRGLEVGGIGFDNVYRVFKRVDSLNVSGAPHTNDVRMGDLRDLGLHHVGSDGSPAADTKLNSGEAKPLSS